MDQQSAPHRSAATTAADAEFLSQLSSSSTAVGDLHKSNLVRLQVEELIAASAVDYPHAKWHAAALAYIQTVSSLIENLTLDGVQWNDPTSPWHNNNRYYGDMKSLPPTLPKSTPRLQVKVTGSTAAEGLGIMTTGANAKVLPALHLRVNMPASAIVQPKDHLKHRYFVVRGVISDALLWKKARIRCCGCTVAVFCGLTGCTFSYFCGA